MAKIIREGNKHEVAVCVYCKCIFSYLPFEVRKDRKDRYVQCPDCSRYTIVKTEYEENITQEAE